MKKIFLFLCLLFCSAVYAQGNIPGGYIGRVLNNTPGTWQNYSFTFTSATTGSNYFMLAFRQDPAYWRVDNIKVTAPGSSTNLLTNGDMSTGGGISVNNGQQYIQAPTAWGVAYQNGTYPAAAGMWTGGLWYDGAVGSYDAIYQAIRLTAGQTYTLSFDVNGDHQATTSTAGWQIGVYAGSCGNVGLAPTECTLPSNAGFTA
jgi:fibronectin-binding autotransporter adhesin